MRTLSEEGLKQAEGVAERHHVSREAVVTLLHALERGNGVQAQFSHTDLGGLGQWSRGGMIMVGDMFNNGLKARVDQLCTELSELMHAHAMFKPAMRGDARQGSSSQGSSWQSSSFASGWWPEACGAPSASGSQNDMRYACFPESHRVAIQRAGVVSVYDTGDHRISGVSQQQSGSQDLTFTSQHGTVRLHELTRVDEDAPMSCDEPTPPPASRPADVKREGRAASADDDVFAKIERLHELQQRGILSETEFAEKKKELLARI